MFQEELYRKSKRKFYVQLYIFRQICCLLDTFGNMVQPGRSQMTI